MYQLMDVRQSHSYVMLDIALDHTQLHNHNLRVLLTLPLPATGVTWDNYLQQILTDAEPQLAATLAVRTAPTYDPLSKWRGYAWAGGNVTIPA